MTLDRFVFIDEFGATTQMQRTHGRAPRGQRVVSKVPHGHWKVLSTIAAMTTRGIACSATFDGATDTDTFVAFANDLLATSLRTGQVVVMDNLSPHKHPRVRAAIEAAGCELMLLPPYSPDFNPIEQAISKVKTVLRKLACRDVAFLYDAIGEALKTVTPHNARAFMQHSGYVLR
jgi:transposase